MKRQGSHRTVWLGVVMCIVAGGEECTKADFFVSEATCVDQVINNGTNTQECSFLQDGLKLYFSHSLPGGYGGLRDIWVASRKTPDAPWEEPINLGPNVNSGNECYPAISPDELELYFHLGISSTTLMRSTRASKDAPWGSPEVFTGLGSNACDLDISADGLTVYFDSDRSGGHGSWDIWIATRETVNAPWGEPVNLGPNVNNALDQGYPSISNDGRALFYQNGGLNRISLALRATPDDPWGPPTLLGPAVNGQSWNHGAEISPDGSVLYFDSGRAGGFNNENFWQVKFIPIVDFNGDGLAEIGDLVILIEHWGTADSRCDVGPMPWGDGIVDAADLEVLMSHWGQEPYDPTLIAHWKLDETDGDTACDSSSSYDGSLCGGPVWEPTGGHLDGALRCDGIDDCVATPSVLDPGEGSFSVFAWVKDGAPGQVVLSQKDEVNWLMADAATGALLTELGSTGRQGQVLASQGLITEDTWHRVGFVRDGSDRILYVDDIEVARDTVTSLAESHGLLYIGAGKGLEPGTFWSGLIDDVRIYNRVVRP